MQLYERAFNLFLLQLLTVELLEPSGDYRDWDIWHGATRDDNHDWHWIRDGSPLTFFNWLIQHVSPATVDGFEPNTWPRGNEPLPYDWDFISAVSAPYGAGWVNVG